MPDGRPAAVRPVHQPEPVGDARAAGQGALLLELPENAAAADLAGAEVPVPACEVLHRGEEAGGPDHGEVRDAEAIAARAAGRVGVGAVPDDRRVIVAERGLRHAERLEQARGSELAERPTRHALDDDREQRISGVAVEVAAARREMHGRLPREQVEHVPLGDDVPFPAPPRHLQQAPLIANPARVVREMTERDGLAEIGKLRHVAPDVVVPRDATVGDEQPHRQGRELLGHGCDVEDRRGRDRDVVLQVGIAVALREQNVAAPHDGHGAAGGAAPGPRLEDQVEAAFRVGALSGRRNDRQRDQEADCRRQAGREVRPPACA